MQTNKQKSMEMRKEEKSYSFKDLFAPHFHNELKQQREKMSK